MYIRSIITVLIAGSMSKRRFIKVLVTVAVIWLGVGSLLNLFGIAYVNSPAFRVYGTSFVGLLITLYVLRADFL